MITEICAPRLFDGKDQLVRGGAAVIFENGRIQYAGKADAAPHISEEAHRISFPDGTILPGLIDAHVHLTMDGSADPVSQTQTDSVAMAMARAIQAAKRQIRAGVTTVRDCGCQANIALDLALAVRERVIECAPRILACGPVICITGGHGAFIGVEADGAEEVRKAVRNAVKHGADFIKVIASGGVLTKGTSAGAPQMTFEELQAAGQEARRAGLKITTHAHATESIKGALRAGFDCVEHASYIDDEIIQLFQETGAYYVPTYVSSVCQMEHLEAIPGYVAEKIQKHITAERQNLERMISLHIPLAGATDAGTPFNVHGNLPRQLNLLHEHGLTAMQALSAGTFGSSRALGLQDETGTLEKGKLADLLVVQGDPVEDLRQLYCVCGVWREGRRMV